MLVLSRKQSESIVIGDDITIKVMRISGGRVRIAIDAPHDVKVSRGEIFESVLSPANESAGEFNARDMRQLYEAEA